MNLPIIEISAPSLVLLIGSSGAGKSTFAARHFQPTEIISSDRCRAMICDDENNQTINAETFGLLHQIARLRLQRRKLTVIDATNLQFRDRLPLLQLAQLCEVPVVAVVFNVSLETCLAHNQARPGRQVEQAILEFHQQQLTATLSTLKSEGYSRVYVLEKSDLANAVVRKLRSHDENLPDGQPAQVGSEH